MYSCMYVFTMKCTYTYIIKYLIIGSVPDSPMLTYKSTYNEILVLWSPVSCDIVCGLVTYNITVIPSHGMMMMINDTAYNITGLNYNTNYTITVYASNKCGHGEPATVTVGTSGIYDTLMYAYLST